MKSKSGVFGFGARSELATLRPSTAIAATGPPVKKATVAGITADTAALKNDLKPKPIWFFPIKKPPQWAACRRPVCPV